MKSASPRELHKKLSDAVRIYTMRYLCNVHDREDCGQEFVAYVLSIADQEKQNVLHSPENEALLRRVARCFVLNWIQSARQRKSLAVCFTELPEIALSSLSTPANPPLAQACIVSAAAAVSRAIAALPAKQRECATRRWLQDQPISEIAIELDLAPSAVRKNLQYARTSLREDLLKRGIEAEDLLSSDH